MVAVSLPLLVRRRSKALLLFFTFLTVTTSLYYISQNHYQLRNILSYATRPLWDTEDSPKHIMPHYYTEGLGIDAYTCKLHGWEERKDHGRTKMLDAVLMSSELDLLEIRLNELDSVVDRFFILESNATFTGLPKERYYLNNRERFSKFAKKISYLPFEGPSEHNEKIAFDVERDTRAAMTKFIHRHMTEFTPNTRSLVVMSDVDEIPSSHTLRLLKTCDFGQSIHLQLRNYIYSFEWFLGLNSWRAAVQEWRTNIPDWRTKFYYRHSKSGDVALADAGWHCSYCFRTIPEYITKMTGFSHSDRIGGNMALLNPQKIQEKICRGKDIFDMLPEAYTYADLLSQMNLEPSTSVMWLPQFLLRNAEKFKFLLPGGCMREDPSTPAKTGEAAQAKPVVDDME